jgi:DNA-binding transcriptional LysR family regulator
MDEDMHFGPESIAPLLTAFDAVAAEGHVTRAAELLGVPQSSVSRRLRSLERILGLALFQPVGRGVALTTSGHEFFQRTHNAIRELDDAVSAVRADADPDSGLVRFGFPLTLGPRSLSTLLAQFHKSASRIRVHLVQAHGQALATMLREGRLDVAVMIPPPGDLPAVILGSQQICLHVSRTHPFAQRQTVGIEELANESFVASPPSFHLRTLLDNWCAEAGFRPRVPFEINEIDTVRALVGSGLGVALLPVAESTDPSVVTVPLTGHRGREVALVTGRYRPTAAVARFHAHVVSSEFLAR